MSVYLFVLPAAAEAAKDRLNGVKCRNDGGCCKRLNRFWRSETTKSKHGENGKYFELTDSPNYPWAEVLSCPTIYSKFAEGLKLLHDFSRTNAASMNYYKWAKTEMAEKEWGFAFREGKGRFASANPAMAAIAFSAYYGSFRELTPATIASTIIHEVNHLAFNSGHVKCTHGQREGIVGCDETFVQNLSSDAGAFSWQLIFQHDLIQSGLSSKVRAPLKANLKTIINNLINTLPRYGPGGKTPIKKYYGIE